MRFFEKKLKTAGSVEELLCNQQQQEKQDQPPEIYVVYLWSINRQDSTVGNALDWGVRERQFKPWFRLATFDFKFLIIILKF